MHAQPGLTTAATKRSPLVAVVALPAVLQDSAADGPTLPLLGAEEGRNSISWTMYHDEGEELEVGAAMAEGQEVCWLCRALIWVRACEACVLAQALPLCGCCPVTDM